MNIKISSDNCNTLLKVILMPKNKEITINLLNEISKLDIIDFEYEQLKYMKTIAEYQFTMIKIKVILKDQTNADIYLKLIPKDRIKESIFCYWCILYDEKFKEYEDSEFSSIVSKVKIIESESEKNNHSVLLSINENKWGVLERGSIIHLVKFEKYIKEFEVEQNNNKNNITDWKRYITNGSQDILFMGIVKN